MTHFLTKKVHHHAMKNSHHSVASETSKDLFINCLFCAASALKTIVFEISSFAPVMTDARASVWRRREAKRRAAVEGVKASREYAACSERPPTPDPSDRALTKRQWERCMQDWRQALRSRVAQRPIDWLGGPEDAELP